MLIVMSGPPGAGKTTLAHAVAREIGCPAICRDEIFEGLALAGTPDPTMRHTLRTFFSVLELLLRAGVTTVAEAAFQDRLWRPGLEPLAALADIRVVRCVLDPETALSRMKHRLVAEPTRAAHRDAAYLSNPKPWEPIAMDVPTLLVDTTDGYSPELPEIVRFARA